MPPPDVYDCNTTVVNTNHSSATICQLYSDIIWQLRQQQPAKLTQPQPETVAPGCDMLTAWLSWDWVSWQLCWHKHWASATADLKSLPSPASQSCCESDSLAALRAESASEVNSQLNFHFSGNSINHRAEVSGGESQKTFSPYKWSSFTKFSDSWWCNFKLK